MIEMIDYIHEKGKEIDYVIVYQIDREKTDFSYRLHFLQERLDSIASQENQTTSPQRT